MPPPRSPAVRRPRAYPWTSLSRDRRGVRLPAPTFLLDHHRPVSAEARDQRIAVEADHGLRQAQDQHRLDDAEADPQVGVEQHTESAAEYPRQLERRLRTPEGRRA